MRLEALKVHCHVSCLGSGADRLAAAVTEAWDWCLSDPAYDGPAHPLRIVLEADDAKRAELERDCALAAPDLPTVLDRLTPLVTWLAITERRADLVMFHACAVADPVTGDAVALYGPSGTGKTTLARTLCDDLVYLSDETAAVAPDLTVVPYPKPLSILGETGRPPKEQTSAGRLGLRRPEQRAYRLRALVQLRREADHIGAAQVERLATVEALPELAAQTSFTREMTRPLHRLAELAQQTGGVRRVTYAEADQLRSVVRAILDEQA